VGGNSVKFKKKRVCYLGIAVIIAPTANFFQKKFSKKNDFLKTMAPNPPEAGAEGPPPGD
jgi:hypothetical protein